MTREYSRIFLKVILVWKQPWKVNFWTWKLNFNCSTPLNFHFSSITPSFHPKFSNPYCRKGSYGPYGPFWFSANKWFWSLKNNEESFFWEKSLSHFIRKMNLFCRGNFLKRSIIRRRLEAYIFTFRKYWKQPILRTSHPGSHSIKPVNWSAILAATQSNQ